MRMNRKERKTRTLVVSLIVSVAILGSVAVFTPLFGQARFGPMRDFAMGPMGPGMMRDMHAMVDVATELEYMVRMIPHHEEAVENARILRERTEREEMSAFADDIIETQNREIQQMQTWLEQWYPDEDTAFDYTPMMRDYSGLSGEQLDLAFLQDMIPHHMAAVMMSEQLLSDVDIEHAELEELARNIHRTQTQEIGQMRLWLRQWSD